MDFYESWNWLCQHPIFWVPIKNKQTNKWVRLRHADSFQSYLDIDVVKVNPKTNHIDDDKELNIATRVWLECGPWYVDKIRNDSCTSHDSDLDCGGDTFEEAIVKLASLVMEKYGNYNLDNLASNLRLVQDICYPYLTQDYISCAKLETVWINEIHDNHCNQCELVVKKDDKEYYAVKHNEDVDQTRFHIRQCYSTKEKAIINQEHDVREQQNEEEHQYKTCNF